MINNKICKFFTLPFLIRLQFVLITRKRYKNSFLMQNDDQSLHCFIYKRRKLIIK